MSTPVMSSQQIGKDVVNVLFDNACRPSSAGHTHMWQWHAFYIFAITISCIGIGGEPCFMSPELTLIRNEADQLHFASG